MLAFVALLTDPAKAQDTTTVSHPADSLYIEKFKDWIIFKFAVINTSESLVTKTDGFSYIFQPNPSEIFRAYASYRIISLYIDYIPRFLSGNMDDVEKGKSKGIAFGTSLNFHNWFTELSYTRTQGYYLQNTKDFRPNWQPGDPYLQVPDLYVTSFEGATGYNSNPHLSLAATTSQTERQLKSAGSFLPKLSYRYYIIDNRTPVVTFTQKAANLQALLGAGYQYTFVWNKTFYLTGAFTPSFGYIFSKVTTRTPTDHSSFTQRGPIYQWDAKLGLGYNGHRIFTGAYLTAISSQYAQGLSTAVNQNASVYLQLFFGVRLIAPKFIQKTYAKVFH
jgi:hypothetical protein